MHAQSKGTATAPCPLLAQSGHHDGAEECPLLDEDQTLGNGAPAVRF